MDLIFVHLRGYFAQRESFVGESFLSYLKFLVLCSLAIMSFARPSQAQTAAPIISVPSSTFAAPSQVAIAGPTGSTVFYSVDGSTPTSSSPQYFGPVNVDYSLTLKSVAVFGGVSSTVSSATYTLNSVEYPAPGPSDLTPLKINLLLPTTGIAP